jgi:hypothetical protein
MALKKLAKEGVIAKDFPVPCHVALEEGRGLADRECPSCRHGRDG